MKIALALSTFSFCCFSCAGAPHGLTPTRLAKTTFAKAGEEVMTQLHQPVVIKVGQTAIATDTPCRFGITWHFVESSNHLPTTCYLSFQKDGIQHSALYPLPLVGEDKQVLIEDYRVLLLDFHFEEGNDESTKGTFKILPAK